MKLNSPDSLKMKNSGTVVSSASPLDLLSKTTVRWMLFIAGIAFLVSLFWSPLTKLLGHVSRTELNSFIPLLPFVSAYLFWIERNRLSPHWDHRVPLALVLAGIGLATVLFYRIDASYETGKSEGNLLSLQVFAFIALSAALTLFLPGKANFDRAIFPVGFLFLMVPLPEVAVRCLTSFLQYASAHAAYVLMNLTGMPVYREGLVFSLPGLSIEVAEECSGIRSTLVLFITSLLAGHLFLQKPWGKWVLAAAVVPIGILRNGFRIMTISWLTVNVHRGIIDSPIHHRGGPVFFVLSLLPLLGLLIWLRRRDGRNGSNS